MARTYLIYFNMTQIGMSLSKFSESWQEVDIGYSLNIREYIFNIF